ncbi:MAG: type II toxin-antitoxin system RatA family toxin [Rubrivivax sp.]|nr:type II toxin-antitoxin system RatA family toxin [Rubrivivax sp.]
MIVRRSALVDRSAEQLFDLIEAAEHYPKFLPWCSGAHIVERDDTLVSADLRVRWAGVDFAMRTRNPKRRPEYMAIHLERGPFRRFEGEWLLSALTPQACKVAFTLDWEFDSAVMTRVAGPVFARIADTLVDAFVQRAATLAPSSADGAAAPSPLPLPAPPPPSPSSPPA